MIKRIESTGHPKFEIEKLGFEKLKRLNLRPGQEGILFLGCGGDLNHWVNGFNDVLNEHEIGSGEVEDKFSDIFFTETTGGRIDLLFVFSKETNLNIGKLAMWRLRVGDNSWLSDYVVNCAKHH